MGATVPQVVTESSASGAQVIDGSLKFNGPANTALEKTFSSAGNRTSWTWSCWVKRDSIGATAQVIFGGYGAQTNDGWLEIGINNDVAWFTTSGISATGTALRRDTGGWYHFFSTYDGSTLKIYINNNLDLSYSFSGNRGININNRHRIGQTPINVIDRPFYGRLSQCYFIDGQVLGPESFGFTDPLTNTWRPKKYTGTFTGTNTFYLPMDGNSPIGQDKSGQGNNWTPVNFGGSNSLDKATGAKPILNTDGGGNVARPGAFGSEENLFYTVTTANGSVYQFDITSGNNPSLSFIRGATYRFDYTSHSSHPLRFSSTNPDSSTSAYTDGTNTSVSNVITITVPHNAPNTLYYYCTAHASGMNGSISVTTDETKADPYAWKNVLALPLVGSSSDVSNSVNSGSTTKVIGSGGNPAASSATSNFYSGSFQFDGNDYLTIPNTTELTMGTGDFTVEFWYKVSSSFAGSNFYVFDFNSNGLRVQLYNNTIAFATGSSLIQVTVNGADTNSWHHIACVRSSSTAILYYNGINVGTFSSTENITMGSTASIGRYGGSGNYYSGYLQDFRVYKGVAKYTSNFIPASTNPDILPDTPSGVSGGSKLAKVTDGAVSFDGTGDFLSLASSTDFGLVEGNWTIECYAYIQGLTNTYGRLWYLEGSDAGKIDGVYFSNTHMSMGTTNVWSVGDGTGGEYRRNTWMHVAVCHDSTNMRMYIDGVQALTSSNNFQNSSSKKLTLMSTNNGSYGGLGKGFISNFRILKGTALYTANFTPPTRELTNVTNTKLLCCQSNTSAIEGAVKPGTITAAGNAAATNFNPFITDINAVLGQETGYPTWNPLVKSTSTLSNGNLTITTNGGSGYPIELVNTFTPKGRGQWYWEFVLSALSGTNYTLVGMLPSDSPYSQGTSNHFAEAAVRGFYVYVGYNGAVLAYSGAATAGSATATIGVGGVVGWAYDAENGTLKCFIDGVPQGTQFTNIRTDVGWLFGVTDYDNSATASYTINFGQKPFKYAPPEGFQPLNAANIKPDTVIARSDQFVGATLYSGNNGTTQVTTGFQPDFIWLKGRSEVLTHRLVDSVRGDYQLKSNTADAQSAWTMVDILSNGFNVTNDGNEQNKSGTTYVSWCWKAGGDKNTFNIDDVGYASASDVNMSVGGIRGVQNVTAGNDYSAGWAGASAYWSNTDSWSGLPARSGMSKGYWPNTETLSDGSVISVGNGSFGAVSNGSGGHVLRASTTCTLKFTVYYHITEIAVTTSDSQTFADRTIIATNPAQGSFVEATGKCFWFTTNSNVPNIAAIGTVNNAPAQPTIAATGCSVGTRQGFSIIKYEGNGTSGAQLPHGLTQAPDFVVVKNLEESESWGVYHSSQGGTKYAFLNVDNGFSASSALWNNTNTTSSVLTLGNYNGTNKDNIDFIAYLWHDVPGLQKFGKYTGNNTAAPNGPFVELGFRPALVAIKRSNGVGNWVVYDNKRDTFNPLDGRLKWNTSGANVDNSGYNIDFLSNGFKITGGNNDNYNAASDYIYCAWAEAPTFNLFGAQSNAR